MAIFHWSPVCSLANKAHIAVEAGDLSQAGQNSAYASRLVFQKQKIELDLFANSSTNEAFEKKVTAIKVFVSLLFFRLFWAEKFISD